MNKLRLNSKIRSKKLLPVFLVLFGAIGSYLIVFSKAATSCSATNICVVYRKNFVADTDHFLTIDDAEAGNYALEGPAFYAQNSSANGASQVYRLWNAGISAHLYTIDPNYKDSLKAAGWVEETQNTFYAFWNQVPNTSQVYQLISPSGNDYLYSLDTNEINNLKAAGWNAAPAFYAYYTNPTPQAPTNASAPTGVVSHAECDYISGWTADADNYNFQNTVHIYVNDTLYSYGPTDQAATINVPGTKHGFWWNLPAALKAPGTYRIRVYGLDLNTAGQYTGGEKNALLSNGEKTYTCGGGTTTNTTTNTTTGGGNTTTTANSNASAPIGNVDHLGCDFINGWAFDPDTSKNSDKSNDVHIYINGALANNAPTNMSSPDVNNLYGITGNHRWYFAIPDKYKSTKNSIEVYSIDFDASGKYVNPPSKTVRILNDYLDCMPKTSSASGSTTATTSEAANKWAPVGTVESYDCNSLKGWSYDADSKSNANDIHVYVNGQPYNTGPTLVFNKAVNDKYGLSGSHGFAFVFPDTLKSTAKRTYDIKVYGISIDSDGKTVRDANNTLLWAGKYSCDENNVTTGAVVTSTATPAGTKNALPAIGEVTSKTCSKVTGWTYDPDTSTSIKIHVYIDGTLFNEYTANLSSKSTLGNYGFEFDIPASFNDGKNHYADIYGLDYDDAGNYIGLNNANIGSFGWSCNSSGQPATAASDSPCPDSGPDLARNASGDSVAAVQNCLRSLQFSLTADGNFGPQTETTVKLFQAAYGRKFLCDLSNSYDFDQIVTGKVNSFTYRLLTAAKKEGWKNVDIITKSIFNDRPSCSTLPIGETAPLTTTGSTGVTVTPGDPTLPRYLFENKSCLTTNEIANAKGQIREPRRTGNITANYFDCMKLGIEAQNNWNSFVATLDKSDSTSISKYYNILTELRWDTDNENDPTIWHITLTLASDNAAQASAEVIDSYRTAPCTLWTNAYKGDEYYEKASIGTLTESLCRSYAYALRVEQYAHDDEVVTDIYADINGEGILISSKTTSKYNYARYPDHVDWNGGEGVSGGVKVRDLRE